MKTGVTPEAGFLRKLTEDTQELSGLAYGAKWGVIAFVVSSVLVGGYFLVKS